jgi:hypothetical protein
MIWFQTNEFHRGKTRVEKDLSQLLIGHFLHQIDHSYIKNVGRQFIVTSVPILPPDEIN